MTDHAADHAPRHAATYRQRAQRLRQAAEKAVTADIKRQMLETATRYDEMARASDETAAAVSGS